MLARTEAGGSKLMRMGWGELRTRSRQEVSKRWDLVRRRLGLSVGGFEVVQPSRACPRFFFDPAELPQLVALLRERAPEEVERTVAEAHRICRHRFDLLGYSGLDYGSGIDWHLDAVHGVRAPRKPWYRIRYLDFDEVGDVKVTWELNRHQHLVTLAKACRFTGEDIFADELLRQWFHWQEENPYPIGVNWASSLEVAFRTLSWLWAGHLLATCPRVPRRFWNALERALSLNGWHIERYLSTYFSPNTHLLGEGVALFSLGTLYPQLSAAARWQALGWQIILQESGRQIQSDGMHFEQSLYYHVYALDFFLHARLLAERNHLTIPVSLDMKLEQMLDVLLHLTQAGSPARFGDDDGGRVFDPTRNRPEHLLDPLSTGAVLFERGRFKAAAGRLREETLWLLGRKGAEAFDRLPAAPLPPASRAFEPSGLYVMADSQPCSYQLVVDAGPQGTGSAGHGHADALSLHLTLEGQRCLIDPGTCAYVAEDGVRGQFRGTAAHNTLQVDDADQAEPVGPFAWRGLPQVQAQSWAAGESCDLLLATHTGYQRLRPPVTHQRLVFHLKSRFWLVHDTALGEGRRRLALFWHFAPGVLRLAATGATLFCGAERPLLALVAAEDHGWLEEIRPGWWSPVYGKMEPAPVLCFRAQTELPAEFATVLAPAKAADEPGFLTRMSSPADAVSVYRYKTPRDEHFFFLARSGQPWSWGRWASDARFLYCCRCSGETLQWVLAGGSYLDVDGRRVVSFDSPARFWEWQRPAGDERASDSKESPSAKLEAEALLEGVPVAGGRDARGDD